MVLSAGSLQAQVNCNEATQLGMQCQTTTDLSATVPYLAVINKNITSATLPAATVTNMDGYSSAVAGPTLNIKANFVWTLTASMGGFAQVTAQGVVAGANLVLVDFHPNPREALVDGPQALLLDELPRYLEDVALCREPYEKRRRLWNAC
jgi:hypothetical protein